MADYCVQTHKAVQAGLQKQAAFQTPKYLPAAADAYQPTDIAIKYVQTKEAEDSHTGRCIPTGHVEQAGDATVDTNFAMRPSGSSAAADWAVFMDHGMFTETDATEATECNAGWTTVTGNLDDATHVAVGECLATLWAGKGLVFRVVFA